MDTDRLKGMANKVKGGIKNLTGKATGDKKMEAEGKLDQAKGSTQNTVGGVKDTARDVVDD